jgi:hypothetical protein
LPVLISTLFILPMASNMDDGSGMDIPRKHWEETVICLIRLVRATCEVWRYVSAGLEDEF